MSLVVLNFAHPLLTDHLKQIENLTEQPVSRVIEINSQVDPFQPLIAQVVALIDQVGFSSTEWQTLPFVVNPPSLNYFALLVLAELHGRCGYFSPIMRFRPILNSMPPRYEVVEIINLQAVRDEARTKRK